MITYQSNPAWERHLRTPLHRDVLDHFAFFVFCSQGEWSKEFVLSCMKQTKATTGASMKVIYEVLTGEPRGLPLPETLVAMGRAWTMTRLFDMTAWELEHPLKEEKQ